MIAIAESGSTKSEWVILNDDNQVVKQFKTQGYNPDFHSSDYVFESLSASEEVACMKEQVRAVYFYGASCSSNRLNKIIADGLQRIFSEASILVDHDLLAAAYSLYEGEPLICCISGTGSNSCFYDGEQVTERVPALGFIMGDESGGAFFGKKLLKDFFYERLPQNMQQDFASTYQLTWELARKEIYGNVHANVYLASFMPFIAKHREEEYVLQMIREGFAQFIEVHVKGYQKEVACKVGFVGSIAYIFKNILEEELNKQGFQVGKVIKSPILELVKYHINYILSDQKTSKIIHTGFKNGISA